MTTPYPLILSDYSYRADLRASGLLRGRLPPVMARLMRMRGLRTVMGECAMRWRRSTEADVAGGNGDVFTAAAFNAARASSSPLNAMGDMLRRRVVVCAV